MHCTRLPSLRLARFADACGADAEVEPTADGFDISVVADGVHGVFTRHAPRSARLGIPALRRQFSRHAIGHRVLLPGQARRYCRQCRRRETSTAGSWREVERRDAGARPAAASRVWCPAVGPRCCASSPGYQVANGGGSTTSGRRRRRSPASGQGRTCSAVGNAASSSCFRGSAAAASGRCARGYRWGSCAGVLNASLALATAAFISSGVAKGHGLPLACVVDHVAPLASVLDSTSWPLISNDGGGRDGGGCVHGVLVSSKGGDRWMNASCPWYVCKNKCNMIIVHF